jgi:hypothetical protein
MVELLRKCAGVILELHVPGMNVESGVSDSAVSGAARLRPSGYGAAAFAWLARAEAHASATVARERRVSFTFASWNQMGEWLFDNAPGANRFLAVPMG